MPGNNIVSFSGIYPSLCCCQGVQKIVREMLHHTPPTGTEVEHAIMLLGDCIVPARSKVLPGYLLLTADSVMHEFMR